MVHNAHFTTAKQYQPGTFWLVHSNKSPEGKVAQLKHEGKKEFFEIGKKPYQKFVGNPENWHLTLTGPFESAREASKFREDAQQPFKEAM